MGKRHNDWHLHFCVFRIGVQTASEFSQCVEGTRTVFMRRVWRQDIIQASYTHRSSLFRYVDSSHDKSPIC